MHRVPSWKQRIVAITTASALSVGLVTVSAWGQEDPTKQVAAKPVQKTYAFEFRDTPWDKVLDWLADNSGGMPIMGSLKPQGSFNFISPAGKKYTLPQIIDILNSSLLKDKIIIVRNKHNYMLASSEEPQNIDTTNLPNITVEDLEIDKPYDQQRYGSSELCQLSFTLNSIPVDEAETNLNSRKGHFGKFQKIPRANMLLVTDTVANLRHMKKLLDTIDPATGNEDFEVFSLRPSVDGTSMETSVKGLFNLNPGQTNPVPNAPKIQFEPTQNKLLIKGDKSQLRQIRNLLQSLNALKATAPVEPGKQGAAPQASVEDSIRTVTLKTGNASQFVDNLRYMLSSLRANEVFVTYEPVLAQELENSRKGLKPKLNENKLDQLVDEKKPEPNIQNKPGDAKKPIFIASLSRTNGVIIGSDDAEALDFAEQILVYLTKEGDEYYEIIPLKNSNAQTVRDTLDELINGKRQQNNNPFGAMMPFGGGGGRPMEGITGPTVRLAADKRTNSILVRAPRQIVVTIRRFIETELDVNNIDQKLQLKPRIVKLVNADATDMENVLKEIYKEYVESRPTNNQQPGMPFNPFMQQQRQQEPERSIKFYVAANTKDNSLVMNCPDILWKEVSDLLTDLDKEAVDANRQVKVINVGKADPQMLQRAVDAITGKSRTNAQGGQGQMDPAQAMRNAMTQRFGGMGGMGGFGGGGGNQGGGGGGNRGMGGGGNRGGGNRGGGRGGRLNRTEEPPPIFAPSTQVQPGGPDFFGDRVKEDPRTKVTFAQDNQNNNNSIQQTGAQAPAGQPQGQGNQPPAQPQPPQDKNLLAAPRGDVIVEVLPDGQVILIGSKEEIAELEEILLQLAKSSPSAETELKMFPLEFLDATAATNQLSTIFARYNPIVRIISGTSAMGAPATGAGVGGARPGGFGQGGFGQGGFGQGLFGQGGFGQQQQQQQQPAGAAAQPMQPGSMLIMSIIRQNSVLIGAPKTAMAEIEKTIKLIDKPNDPKSVPKIINLRRANAQTIATTIQQFYQQRYGTAEPNEIRIQPDIKLNSLLIHAGPEDLKEIMNLIEFFDKAETRVINEVRIKQLKNADAQTLAALLQQALSQALLGTATQQQGAQGQQGFQQPNIFGGGGLAGLFGNQANRFGAQGATQDRRGVSLAFTQPGQARIETGLLDDVGIYADVRTNRLVISAPPESISMLEKLIDELDVPPTVTADVKVFRLKNTDANMAMQTLQGVFLGNQQRAGQQGFGNLGGFQQGGFGNQQQQQMMNFSAAQGQGPQPLIPRFSVDIRTNSLIVAAGRGDMILIDVLLNNLDSSAIRDRQFQVVRLKNNQAGNVATNLNSFYRNEITILQLNDLTTFMQSDREVTVIADATNNSLIVGASQRFFPEVMRLIDQLDIELAQVAIQVLIAKVDLDNSDEFGVEVGLQSPVLFQRSLFNPPAETTDEQPAIGNPGFNWNNVSTVNPNNASNIHADVVGMQGLTNYGLGRARNGIGGFVFSAASDSVNVLVRALRTQGRIEVLSRPQIVTRDNQQALISVGQQVPIITGVNINAQGLITNNIEQQQVGIILKVLPQISPDGRVVMRVEPQVSSISPSTVDLGNGVQGTILDQTIASTTIDAMDGKTVVIGGLISKRDEKLQRGIPWLGDLPYIGALFRYRSHIKQKSELLIILTPHIIRNPMDAERVFMEEARKMSWSLDDVQSIHGALPGASFLKENCNENSLPQAIVNPFEQNYFAPNATQPGVDEKLRAPGTVQPVPQAPYNTVPPPSANPPVGNPPGANPPGTNPGWMQPPGATPPKYQQLPPGQSMTYGQAMQMQMAEQGVQYAPAQNFQPTQNHQIGNYRTSVSYAPAPGATLPSPMMVPSKELPQPRPMQPASSNTGFASGGQQP